MALLEKTLLGQSNDPCSETKSGLRGRCHPALARTSRSNSFDCQAEAARHQEPPPPGGQASRGALPRVAAPRGCSRGQPSAKDLLGKGEPICLYLSPRSGAAEPVSAGGRPKAQVGSGVQVELAPHVAGRASFTALTGGGGAERAHGSCDRRLAKYRRAQLTSARARPSRPSPCSSAERGGGDASAVGGGAEMAL